MKVTENKEKNMKQIFSRKAPAAIGPYCHAIINDNLIFCSGQIPLDPESMEIVGNNIEDQTEQVMKNIKSVLSECGSGVDKILKTTVFLARMEDFAGMNKVYEQWLNGHKPARSAIQAGKLPKGALIEIECIAALI